MARLNTARTTSAGRAASIYRDLSPHDSSMSRGSVAALSPTPSSDKENEPYSGAATTRSAKDKGKGTMGPPKLPTPTSDTMETPQPSKRRRLGEHSIPLASQRPHDGAAGGRILDLQFYDPDQKPEERREIRRQLRDMSRNFHEKRHEFLDPQSTGILEYVRKSNEVFTRVKQTSDATIDSRLLVDASNLTYKKASLLALGDSSVGIDLDEFVSKCINFMRRGGEQRADDDEADERIGAQQSTRRRASRRSQITDDEEEELDNEDEAMDWGHLGSHACFPTNRRPPVPGFLLGPLSVQKRARAQSQRKPRTQREAGTQRAVNPTNISAEDLERAESNNLTALCKDIHKRLTDVTEQRRRQVQDEVDEDVDDDAFLEAMKNKGLTDNDGINLFEFALNPRSFGQSVENLFYISFLIKEGNVGIENDEDGLPALKLQTPRNLKEHREQNISKHQAVFSLDWGTWKSMVKVFNIKEPLIPERNDAHGQQVSANGWYA